VAIANLFLRLAVATRAHSKERARSLSRIDEKAAMTDQQCDIDRTETLEAMASFTDVEDILRTLAYAELRAVMLAWARVPSRHPSELVRGAIDQRLAEASTTAAFSSGSFGEMLRETIRSETAVAFVEAARKAGPVPWQRTLAPGQLGEASGLEIIFHEAGEAAARIRANDPRMLSVAVGLTEYIRARARTHVHCRGTAPQ
jgi:hypothetical protein